MHTQQCTASGVIHACIQWTFTLPCMVSVKTRGKSKSPSLYILLVVA